MSQALSQSSNQLSSCGSISEMLGKVHKRDPAAAQMLFERYYERLVRGVRAKIRRTSDPFIDEEAIAARALFDVFHNAPKGKFPKLHSRDDFWRLLVVIADRRRKNAIRHANAEKRKPKDAAILSESVVFSSDSDAGSGGLQWLESAEPTAEFCDVMQESIQGLLGLLDDSLRKVAVLRLQNYSNPEIGKQINRSQATVERRVKRIREIWAAHGFGPDACSIEGDS